MSEETSTRATWRRLQAYAKPYRWLLVMAALALAVEAAASAAVLEVLKYIVDDIFVAKHFSWWLPLGMVALLFGRGLAGLVSDYAIARSGRNVARDLRMQLMSKYLRTPGSRFDTETVPSMLTRLGADTDQVAQAAVDALKAIVSSLFQVVALLGVMFWNSWKVSLVLLAVS